jgi:hypothetical protein
MLKDKRFWVGFALGYLLIAVWPAANILAKMKGGNK